MKTKNPRQTILDRIVVNGDSGCWEWQRSKNEKGYGMINYGGMIWKAHRLSYIFFVGEINNGLFVCHKCDNPSCVNPDHLFLGTNLDNMRDLVSKRRHFRHGQTHCKHGHEYTSDNTYVYDGDRYCRKCINRRSHDSYKRKLDKQYSSLFKSAK
jgi:hypothetical protein